MAFPAGWGRKCALTVPAAQISGTSHTDFPVLLTLANLPSEMFDSDGSYPALNGGGDIRFSSDSAGTTQLACEIVSFVTDANPANGSAEIWVKIPTLATNAGSGTTFYIWYNKSGETQPAVTDTYGRNAVWADYAAVYHGTTTDDASGNQDLTGTGSPTVNSATSKIGGAFSLSGTGQWFSATGYVPVSAGSYRAESAWVRSTASDDQVITHWGDPSGATNRERWAWQVDGANSDRQRVSINGGYSAGSTDIADSTWHHAAVVFNSGNATTDLVFYVDGASDSTGASSSNVIDTSTDYEIRVGGEATGASTSTDLWEGQLDEIRVRDANLSNITANWIATEYNAANDPAAFVSDGTPESVGGGTNYDETYSASATADLVLTDSWALGYAETFAASAAATLTLTDTYETPSVAYDETYAATGAGALTLTEAWALGYAETLTAAAAADLALTETWALDYAETYAAGATGDLSLTHAYAVGNHYAETYAATAVSVLTLTDAYSAQYSETYATTANSALTLSEAWALGYLETYLAVGVSGLALTDAYDTPAPGVFDETYAASAIADLDMTHAFYTPAAISQVSNPTLQATGTARTLQTSGTVRTLRGRQTIH